MRVSLFVILLLILLFALACCNTKAGDTTQYPISHVYDGDTFEDAYGDVIRLSEIDCPEKDQPFGREASNFTDSILRNANTITILRLYTDPYGRTVAKVYVNSVNLSEILVRYGYAWVYRKFASNRLFELYITAKSRKIGLWSQSNPQPPFLHRKMKNT